MYVDIFKIEVGIYSPANKKNIKNLKNEVNIIVEKEKNL